MELFDNYIKNIEDLLAWHNAKRFSFNKEKVVDVTQEFSLVLQKDCAFELGGNNLPAVGISTITTKPFDKSEVIVYGDELQDIKEDVPFAKIVLLSLNKISEDEQKAFDLIKDLEHLKYKYNIQGFMSRSSGWNYREQIRVSKSAIKDGLSWEIIGNSLLKEYLKEDCVDNAKIIFIVNKKIDFFKLKTISEKITSTTRALNHILDNLLVDCKHCNLKEICDEVEGMKELHMKNAIKGGVVW